MAITDPNDFANLWHWWSASAPGGVEHTDGAATRVYDQKTGVDQLHDWATVYNGLTNVRYGDDLVNGKPVLTYVQGSFSGANNASLNNEFDAAGSNLFLVMQTDSGAKYLAYRYENTVPSPDYARIQQLDLYGFPSLEMRVVPEVTIETPRGTWDTAPLYIIHCHVSPGLTYVKCYDINNAVVGSEIDGASSTSELAVGPWRPVNLAVFSQIGQGQKAILLEMMILGSMDGPTDIQDMLDWISTTWAEASPYPGNHEVTDPSQANDPNCIYFNQNVQIGDKFSYKTETETNGWGVDIDGQGYPIIDSGGATGTDSFIFTISRDGGSTWEPDSAWTFTIGGQPPVGDPGEGTGLGLNLSLRI